MAGQWSPWLVVEDPALAAPNLLTPTSGHFVIIPMPIVHGDYDGAICDKMAYLLIKCYICVCLS